jgi:hypothetical protein
MRSNRLLRLVVLLVPAFSGGCLQTTYQPLYQPGAQIAEPDPFLERRVGYRLTDAFFTTAPSCAAIVTQVETQAPAARAIARLVEDAVERHLAMRLPRVIGAVRLRRVETTLGIDMKAASDRRVFARQARCEALVEIDLARVQDDYMVLWAQRSLTFSLTMSRIADGKVLWQARHSASRADGGLPISIIDLPISAARAVMVTRDPEIFASIADDAVRRMMKTLPDIRGADYTKGHYQRPLVFGQRITR